MLVFSSDRTAVMTHLHGMLVGERDCSHSHHFSIFWVSTLINISSASSKRSVERRQLLVAV